MLQYTDLENYGKYIINKINGSLKLSWGYRLDQRLGYLISSGL